MTSGSANSSPRASRFHSAKATASLGSVETTDGAAREDLLARPDAGIAVIVTGLGSLAYGELAGERMPLGFMLHDPEEEQDCCSDNTHDSRFHDVAGMVAVHSVVYRRVGGAEANGPGLSSLVAHAAPEASCTVATRLEAAWREAGQAWQGAQHRPLTVRHVHADRRSARRSADRCGRPPALGRRAPDKRLLALQAA